MNRKYKHVVVVGIDGAGSFIKDADTPNFDRIFANGTITYSALASYPTISAECWGSMLIGTDPKVHKLTNDVVSSRPYPVDSDLPTVFRRIKEQYPEAELGSYCNWNPINYGIVENNLGVSCDTEKDDVLVPMICEYIRKKKPDFLFIQLDSIDGAGHRFGYGTANYMKQINVVDGYVNDIYQAICDAGMLDETLFIAIADHGGTNPGEGTGGSHGGWTNEEKYVTFAATGKEINHAVINDMNIRDLAAVILYAFGIHSPEFDENAWTAQLPKGLFKDTL